MQTDEVGRKEEHAKRRREDKSENSEPRGEK